MCSHVEDFEFSQYINTIDADCGKREMDASRLLLCDVVHFFGFPFHAMSLHIVCSPPQIVIDRAAQKAGPVR